MSEIPRTRKVRVWNRGEDDIVNERILPIDHLFSLKKGASAEVPRSIALAIRGHFPGHYPAGHMRAGHPKEWNFVFEAVPESGSSLKNDARDYVCPVCFAKFPSEADLAAHINAMHRSDSKFVRVSSEEIKEPPKTEQVTVEVVRKIAFCPHCEREIDITKSKMGYNNHVAACSAKKNSATKQNEPQTIAA